MPPWIRILWFTMETTKTLQSIWKVSLSQLLNQRTVELGRPPRLAILGIGNLLRSDDAAGMLVARALSQQEWAENTDKLLILEAGQAPENGTAELRRFAPDLVLLVDAADMGKRPGTIQWVPEEEIDGISASTHSLPLSMLARYLALEMSCKVILLGIQPASNEIGETVSAEVLQAVDEVIRGMAELFGNSIPPNFE